MEKCINRLINKSFKKTLLDQPVPNKKVKFSLRGNKSKLETIKLPEPIKPTPTPKPLPKTTPTSSTFKTQTIAIVQAWIIA